METPADDSLPLWKVLRRIDFICFHQNQNLQDTFRVHKLVLVIYMIMFEDVAFGYGL